MTFITAEVQEIAVNDILSACAKLMAEFKRSEHSSWDPDEEIQTWDKRKAVLAGDEASEHEVIEDESAPVAGSPKPVEGVDPESDEPNVGTKEVTPKSVEVAPSAEDIVGG